MVVFGGVSPNADFPPLPTEPSSLYSSSRVCNFKLANSFSAGALEALAMSTASSKLSSLLRRRGGKRGKAGATSSCHNHVTRDISITSYLAGSPGSTRNQKGEWDMTLEKKIPIVPLKILLGRRKLGKTRWHKFNLPLAESRHLVVMPRGLYRG